MSPIPAPTLNSFVEVPTLTLGVPFTSVAMLSSTSAPILTVNLSRSCWMKTRVAGRRSLAAGGTVMMAGAGRRWRTRCSRAATTSTGAAHQPEDCSTAVFGENIPDRILTTRSG